MKKILTIAIALLLGISCFAQNAKSIYNKYSDAENVSAVYISPAMFRMMGKLPDMDLKGEDVNLTALIRSMKGFFLIDSENPEISGKMVKDVNHFVDSGKYELLMEAKDSGEKVRIYTMGDEKTIEGFVMTAIDKDSCTFIFLDGQMNRAELEKLLMNN